ncbi:class I SAM-dependent methyltransferase [Flagellimonas pelagia]|uniref:SAM-dependent methyltransferase n=1 Tax=Flagellimonas pelagia TaxID=2306998 RepID=A0A3A1NPM1_9FLAO|nr:class I SAM-dependent methyltransferase [Allomuricauda maritima]RIV45371.1 SAM-dependent methyltransferase [Allomuricauda maritima]TXJ96847.1 SAM-dependent methyltransferase [Allomuricauda maritima]
MENLNQRIENHYLKEGLYEDIVNRLKEQNIPLDKVKRSDIAGVDEFHVRGAIVSKELANSIDLDGLHVLDIGCGLGGPCRMLVEEHGCRTSGIDLSHEYIRTAKKLSELVNLDQGTSFVQGNATQLPFQDNSFDIVWTQHVQMNIPDKKKFYSEINRVLKNGGRFIFYDILQKGDGQINYPMPWASNAHLSFLFKTKEMDDLLKEFGFIEEQSVDQTQAGIDFFESLLARLKESGPPKMGLNVLMGETTKPKLMNLLFHLKSGELELKSGVYKKP